VRKKKSNFSQPTLKYERAIESIALFFEELVPAGVLVALNVYFYCFSLYINGTIGGGGRVKT
jgi:hypothetical protein